MIDRRKFNLGVVGTAATVSTTGLLVGPALAQTTITQRWDEYRSIVDEANRLGLAAPRLGLGLHKLDKDRALPVFGDLLEALERSAETESQQSEAADGLIERAAELVRATSADDTAPSEGRHGTQVVRSLSTIKRPVLDDNLKAEYERLFRTAKVNSKHRSTVAWYVNRLKDPGNRARYQRVAEQACIPWFAVGIIHGMEASFNFRGHLHNGDSLKSKTKQIPRNRPKVWNPPNSWELSAVDALQHDKLDNQSDWSLPATLFRWEAYNGFKSRVLHNINTPYLWSFSNHYTKGKYVADNKWNGNAVSRQCGAAVMLKVLVDEGLVTIPSA